MMLHAFLPRDCPVTQAMLRRADSVGSVQAESRAQMAMLPRLRPRSLCDLVVQVLMGNILHQFIIAFSRPDYLPLPVGMFG